MKGVLQSIKTFWNEEGKKVDLSKYYQESDYGWKIAIPINKKTGNVFFLVVHYVEIDELSAKTPNNALRKIARDLLPKLEIERHPWLIKSEIYLFNVKKIIGKFMRCRREPRGDDYNFYYFFSRLPKNQVKFRYYKIVGANLKGRAEGIVKSCLRKIKREPYDYLKRMVEFLKQLGEKLYQIGIKNIVWKGKKKEEKKKGVKSITQNPKFLKEVYEFLKQAFGKEVARQMFLVAGLFEPSKHDFG